MKYIRNCVAYIQMLYASVKIASRHIDRYKKNKIITKNGLFGLVLR